MTDIKTKTQGKWKSLLGMFGVDDRVLDGKHHPCPICPGTGGRDRFRFDDREGKGTYICSQCGAGDGFGFLMKLKGWEFKETVAELEKIVGKATREVAKAKPDDMRMREWMRQIWDSGKPVERFDPVGKFLERRGLVLSDYPKTIRYVEKCYYQKGEYHPAMVSIFQGPDGKAGQLHKTYLTFDGQKAKVEKPRLVMQLSFPEGGAVRLMPINELKTLGVAEGIETALAAGVIYQIPVWAALTKTQLMKFQPPEDIEELFIFSDNDQNFAGQSHAFNLASKVSHKFPEMVVQVCTPPVIGTDWNDFLVTQRKVA